MKTYHKINTGITTPQGRALDYFQLVHTCIECKTNTSTADIIFFEYLIDAQESKPPPAGRTVEWTSSAVTDQGRLSEVLDFDNVQTTSNDFISLIGAVEV